MIRSPLGLRLDPDRSVKEQFRDAARLGAKGVVADATGELAPDRLSETGRREVRHLLRTVQIELIALNLPTRRPFDSLEQLEDRLARADRAFSLAYDLGSRLVVARVGAIPPESEAARREVFSHALRELGRRADHRGTRFAIEAGNEPGEEVVGILNGLGTAGLAASLDPATLLGHGHDLGSTVRALGPWLAHAYATAPGRAGQGTRLSLPGSGLPPGALDWEEYLGALEEVHYRGFLTVWPASAADASAEFTAVSELLSRF
jgi:sugar phosphate isomerase/epimerase